MERDPVTGQIKKGASLNPNGRPKRGTAISDLLRMKRDEEVLHRGEIKTAGEAIADEIIHRAIEGDQWAINQYLDRTEGKPVQATINTNIEDVETNSNSVDTLIAKLEAIRAKRSIANESEETKQ